MEFTKEDYLRLTDSDKLELLEFVIDDIRLKDIDNPIKEINFNYFIDEIINKINNGEIDNPNLTVVKNGRKRIK